MTTGKRIRPTWSSADWSRGALAAVYEQAAATAGLALALLASLVPADAQEPSAGKILFLDNFDDGDPLMNTRGIGGGWRAQAIARKAVKVEEVDGAVAISLGTEHASYALKQDTGTIDFWNTTGVVAEFVVKDTTVRSAHTWDFCNAYAWQFGFISADYSRDELPWLGSWPKEGAMWFTLGRKDASDLAEFSVYVSNKTLANTEGRDHPSWGTPGYARPVSFRFKIKYPVTIRIHLDAKKWRFELPGQEIGPQKSSFDWSTALGTARITTEFQRGAWMLVHARLLGLTGGGSLMTPLHSGENFGRLESVRVIAGRD